MTAPHGRVGDVPVETLVATHGSPLYAYDAAVIRRRAALLTETLDGLPGAAYFSLKANPALGLVRRLRALGFGADACSPGDLNLAARAGFPAAEVTFVGVSLSDEDLDAVIDADCLFVADSLNQVERYATHSRRRRDDVAFRLNCDVSAGFHSHVQAGSWSSKFGLHPPQLPEAAAAAARGGLRVTGLHAHIGSDILDAQPHLEVLCRLLDLGKDLPDLEFVDVGGGFGTPFLPEDKEYPVAFFRDRAALLLNEEERRRGRRVELRLEPGAFLLMDAGVLLTRVTEIKAPVNLGQLVTPRFVGVDTSFNHVVSAVIYGTHHPISLGRPGSPGAGLVPTTVVGNLMQAGDVLARDRPLPEDLRVGDVLVIAKVGAYSSSRATVFNERPRPAEVLVDGSDVQLLRRRQTVHDLLALDVTP